MKIYSKTGDLGTTQLFSGERIPKNSLRIELYGTIDELQSVLILASVFGVPEALNSDIIALREELVMLATELATSPDNAKKIEHITEKNILQLEQKIDKYFAKLPKLSGFVTSYTTPGAAFLNNARTICRRAERLAISVNINNELSAEVMKYMNRLSDYLFAAALYSEMSR